MKKTKLTTKEIQRIKYFLKKLSKIYSQEQRELFKLPNSFIESLTHHQRDKLRKITKELHRTKGKIEPIIKKLEDWEKKNNLDIRFIFLEEEHPKSFLLEKETSERKDENRI